MPAQDAGQAVPEGCSGTIRLLAVITSIGGGLGDTQPWIIDEATRRFGEHVPAYPAESKPTAKTRAESKCAIEC
jgi:hypothetical protein